ncbi:ABC transporter permease [Limisphaera sp. 4302-co]|uniref:ABC transporter permease n=1 Tax=Limisphaera sp. 4302-co TaxID=3400417 RepID=UPI003C26FB67
MQALWNIAVNAFMELVRQPVFLLLMTSSALFEIFLAVPYYFAFGDEPKLVKNSALAVALLSGLAGSVLSASASVARELRTGTALAVLSKPVGKTRFLLAKYLGLAAALTVLTYVNVVAALVAGRMAFDAYGETDVRALGIFAGAVVAAYLYGGFANYFLRRPFVSHTIGALIPLVTLAAVLIGEFSPHAPSLYEQAAYDWRILPAGLLILFALWLLAAVALACSTRLEMIPTLAVCTGVFLLGLVADYLYSRMGGTLEGGPWWATTLYTLLPNWQLFWLGDLLETGRGSFHWGYVGKALAYTVGFVGALLAVAAALFEDRELS